MAAGKREKLKFPPLPESPQTLTEPLVEPPATRSFHRASQTGPMESANSRPDWLAEVMAAIATCQSTLTAKVEAVQMDVGLLRQDMDRTRVADTEQRISNTEDTVTEHGVALHIFQTKVKALEYRAEDAKNRNRRNNLRIVGLAEGSEGANPTCFLEDMLRNLLPDAYLSPHYAVERAHRIPPKKCLPQLHLLCPVYIKWGRRHQVCGLAPPGGNLRKCPWQGQGQENSTACLFYTVTFLLRTARSLPDIPTH